MSRLLSNSENIRKSLNARKLYTPENPYDISLSNTAESINNLVGILSPFKSIDLSNTIIGKLVLENSSLGQNTPLAKIGLEMIGNQFGKTAASNAAAAFLPSINLSNIFDKNKYNNNIFKKDFQITRRDNLVNIGMIIDEIAGINLFTRYPFDRNSTNIDYVKNTGKGQLIILTDNLNRNKYRPSNITFNTTLIEDKLEYGSTSIELINYFSGNNQEFKPFNKRIYDFNNISNINSKLNNEIIRYRDLNNGRDGYLGYGTNQQYIDDLGKTKLFNKTFDYFRLVNDYGLDDDPNNKLIWGRDGVNDKYLNETKAFDDPSKDIDTNLPKSNRFNYTNREGQFDLNAGGLLSYTRELLNSQGRNSMFDLTKKKFLDEDGDEHFNGSPLSNEIDFSVNRKRQHNVTDPYNNYVKAIRYDGNKIYNGNENSVIYDTVIPKVAPTVGSVNKNMMFSIENLAVKVNADEESTIAYVDDDYGTVLPISEKGDNGGRLMWFPPYDIQISENIVVNRTTTNFIGRGEPIYTYNNTERIGSLGFKLIIDYPPQVKGFNHARASSFFAFGGTDNEKPTYDISAKVKELENTIAERDELKEVTFIQAPEIVKKEIWFYFANDQPKVGGVSNSVEFHISNGYEINNDPSFDGVNLNLNTPFQRDFDKLIEEYLDEEKLPFVEIKIEGFASTLYTGSQSSEEYNLKLSERRANAIKEYINKTYSNIFEGSKLKSDRPIFRIIAEGEKGGVLTDEENEISTLGAKVVRSAKITFKDNGRQNLKEVVKSRKELEDLDILNKKISTLELEIARMKNSLSNVGRFKTYTIENGILKGFSSIENNNYKPVFHSQTPEDFHRRLTFLHQCTRQGNAIRKNRGDNTFSASNSVFGRQPVQILRIGDMFHTKIFIDNMQVDYSDAPWDLNPEGMGMQFMIADIKLQLKIVGGQSLKGAIDMLQNAVSFNYYANSTFYNDGVYKTATEMENLQFPPDKNKN